MLILASNSPRRKELITEYITSDFLIIPSSVNEVYDENKSIEENIFHIARLKGEDVYNSHPNDIVISADTMVIFDNLVLGKPKDKLDAKRMLTMLSDKEHIVLTAYYIFKGDTVISKVIKSIVKFKPLSSSFIDEYVNSLSPLDKAGAYGIQDDMMKEKIEYYKGSLSNIIGLPIEDIKKDLEGQK